VSKIRVLPELLANKIAAGEVVERPASVAKELVENALDARATRIEVEIAGAGRSLVRVSDDGEGMTRDDAILAFERHATSKLRTAEDLMAIASFGFRGEALPSIASVSKLTLTTRSHPEVAGTQLTINGGRLGAVRDVAWPGGTEVAVKDLFFNMPARRKFLKSDATESFHVTNLVTHYALANPGVAFSLVNNGRETIGVPPVGTLRERAYQLLGAPLVDRLVEVETEANGVRVRGYVSNPQEQRTSREAQYLFVNGRYVRDRLLGRAIMDGFRSMMPSGTYPAAILFVELPPDRIDVNVHPAKTEVRFREEQFVRQIVGSAIRDALERARRPVAVFPAPEVHGVASIDVDAEPEAHQTTAAPPPVRAWPPLPRPDQPALAIGYRVPSPAAASPALEEPPAVAQWFARDDTQPRETSGDDARTEPSHRGLALVDDRSAHHEGEISGRVRPLGQIRRSFVVATDDEGLLLIDQHVAHERILFERFRARNTAAPPARQQLLIPETIDLTPAQAVSFERLQPELESAGFDLLMLSGRTVAITSVPAELPAGDTRTLLTELLEAVDAAEGRGSLDVLREVIAASLACRAAIKINMSLTDEKMTWLIDELLATENPWTCPHGRPILLRFTIRDIEKQFQRPEGFRRS